MIMNIYFVGMYIVHYCYSGWRRSGIIQGGGTILGRWTNPRLVLIESGLVDKGTRLIQYCTVYITDGITNLCFEEKSEFKSDFMYSTQTEQNATWNFCRF